MATASASPFRIAAGGTVYVNRLVKNSSGTAILNTSTPTDVPIGVVQPGLDDNYDSGDTLTVKDVKDGGTQRVVAAGTITEGADIYAADDGKVQALPGGGADYRHLGFALEGASGNNSIIEVFFYPAEAVQSPMVLSSNATTGLLLSGDYTNAIKVTGSCTIGIQVGADGSPSGDVIFYGEAAGSFVKWDVDANDQGRFIVAEASTRLTCSHHDGQNTGLGNECCLASRQSHNVTTTTGQTQGGRAILGVYTLESTYTNASELSWAGMFGIQGTMTLDGALNGSAVNAFGVSGELRGAGTQVECDEIAPLATFNNNSVNPTTGRKSMIFSANNSGTVDAVLTHQGSATALFDFDDASGFVVEDNQAYGDKAGHIKIVMPSGSDAYINVYDGSAGS